VDARHRQSAETTRLTIQRGRHDAITFRAALLDVPPRARDQWVDTVLGLGELPDQLQDDGPALPLGCVPYLPCPVDALLRVVDQASIADTDVFVDVGSGLGRAAMLVHLLTGAEAIGIEVQPALARATRDLAARLGLSRVTCIEGDARSFAGFTTSGSVFFFYCPFSGERLAKVLTDLESIAQIRPLRICCVQLPLPPCPWLTLQPSLAEDVAIYRSKFRDRACDEG
jgi:SAM-dependent methyltransferase